MKNLEAIILVTVVKTWYGKEDTWSYISAFFSFFQVAWITGALWRLSEANAAFRILREAREEGAASLGS